MNASASRRWVGATLLLAAFYLIDGLVFGELSKNAASARMLVAWRQAAWVTSGIAFAAHVAYEQLRLRHPATAIARHVSLAAALGAFGLAVAAIIHALSTGTGNLRLLAIALVAWPAITVVPAFLVALAGAALLARIRRD